ncbi:DUF202 domain-containing protein [Nocardia farcinica]|nr:DUF202 domain-containing protein [Nocardia farcinica]MBA4856893.1 DUF202 domain-containing protein [Nocardia farcinica]MBC9815345.1 DUF202 domain-containing protein [Nocardia farcinica]MBF6071422.1 DUF202 domain-containing protein [Nocardia farcinica]MBF6185390.1 DUF202 domain-containing protein [Nocardia farcinica]
MRSERGHGAGRGAARYRFGHRAPGGVEVTLPDRGGETGTDEPAAEIDYRFTLANERTFLAWMRTALGLLAGGVAVHTLVQPFPIGGFRRALALACILLAVIVAVGAYVNWRRIGAAMRRGAPLPDSLLVPILAAGIGLVSMLAAVAVILR